MCYTLKKVVKMLSVSDINTFKHLMLHAEVLDLTKVLFTSLLLCRLLP